MEGRTLGRHDAIHQLCCEDAEGGVGSREVPQVCSFRHPGDQCSSNLESSLLEQAPIQPQAQHQQALYDCIAVEGAGSYQVGQEGVRALLQGSQAVRQSDSRSDMQRIQAGTRMWVREGVCALLQESQVAGEVIIPTAVYSSRASQGRHAWACQRGQ